MEKLEELKAIQKQYSEQLETFVSINNGIDKTESNAFVEAIIYEVLNVIKK